MGEEDLLPRRRGRPPGSGTGTASTKESPSKRQRLDDVNIAINPEEDFDYKDDADRTEEPLAVGSVKNGDEPEKIEGLIKRGKQLLAVVIWKERTTRPKQQDDDAMKSLSGQLGSISTFCE